MGPTTADSNVSFPYYKEVCRKKSLYSAWKKVRENGLKSKSKETRQLIRDFEPDIIHHINSISTKLQRQSFKFSKSKGIPKKRPGKKPRPIVVSPITDRIVQRAILDVLQSNESMVKYVNTIHSYGGIKDPDTSKSVAGAIEALRDTIESGAKWYVQSDIKDFFSNIPRHRVIETVSSFVSDEIFIDLFATATDVELANMIELGKNAKLFPTHELGVAQGCCLSALIGNILLHDFDITLNDRQVTCLRYIDDFIILAETRKKAVSAFQSALRILQSKGLDAYDPLKDISKSKIAKVTEGISFLGCYVKDGIVAPCDESRMRLLNKIDKEIKASIHLFKDPERCYKLNASLVHILSNIDNTVEGWGNQYSFCNDQEAMRNIDKSIDKRLSKYMKVYSERYSKLSLKDIASRRKILGIYLLHDKNY